MLEEERYSGESHEFQARLNPLEKVADSDIMVDSLAHELKNGMTSILNFVQYCLNTTSEDKNRRSGAT